MKGAGIGVQIDYSLEELAAEAASAASAVERTAGRDVLGFDWHQIAGL